MTKAKKEQTLSQWCLWTRVQVEKILCFCEQSARTKSSRCV